jgi:hypothetical protein
MKAITICQPYAELIARGDKPIENRTWPTGYRGEIAIHAGKSRGWLDDGDDQRYAGMVFGAVVAIADLVACLEFYDGSGGETWPTKWRHLREHAHANGPWCWVLENVRRLDVPVFARGALGLWEWRQ